VVVSQNVSEGLADVVAGESAISNIDGKNSTLSYRGYDIHELCEKSNFEETAYLLLYGDLPTSDQLAKMHMDINEELFLPDPVIDMIRATPERAHPMAVLRTGVSLLALHDPESETTSLDTQTRKVMRIMTKVPMMVAFFDRCRKGNDLVQPKKDKGCNTASNFLYMLKGKDADPIEIKMLDKYFILLAEHGFNASTFTARTTASTLSDTYSAIVSAVGTLKGDLHGSANTRAMESLIEIGDAKRVDDYVERALQSKKKIMGFGHRVYKGPDPRAQDLQPMAEELAQTHAEQAKWYGISKKLEKAVYEKKKLYCNVDFYSASILYSLGIPVDMFTTMFAISRVAGWSAHILEQSANNRLIRPISSYTGKTNQKYINIKER
jgi:citrate synthase